MAKTVLEGFNKVAVLTISGKDYHFALYDENDEYKVGDQVIVNGRTSSAVIDAPRIQEIISVEEAKERFKGNICSEVICKIDPSAYKERVAARKEKARIKTEMNRIINKIKEEQGFEFYADKCPEIAELFAKYKEL